MHSHKAKIYPTNLKKVFFFSLQSQYWYRTEISIGSKSNSSIIWTYFKSGPILRDRTTVLFTGSLREYILLEERFR